MTNCINCGAPLHDGKCAYCGTEYRDGKFVCDFERYDSEGTISFYGQKYQVYLSHVEGNIICPEIGRDMSGRLYRSNPQCKRVFTLIEV